MSVKVDRQRALAKLLRSRQVGSQARLLELLHLQGFDATQATVSRDLEDLGAIKIRDAEGHPVYALPEAGDSEPGQREELERALTLWLESAVPAGNLVVLRTPPGHAHALAVALDQAAIDDIAGTVAGDDTVLVVCADGISGKAMAHWLRAIGSTSPVPGGERRGQAARPDDAARPSPTSSTIATTHSIFRGASA
ncbi:MAG TPA: arginine repressor [Actinomycetota bacterium]